MLNLTEPLTKPKTLLQALGHEFSEIGLGFLVSSGTISKSVLEKLARSRPNARCLHIMNLLEQGQLSEVREQAFDPEYLKSTPGFLESGRFPFRAIELGLYDLAKEALEKGYKFSPGFLLSLIKEGNLSKVRTLILQGLVPEEAELEFWYLMHTKHTDLAFKLLEKRPNLQNLVKGYALSVNPQQFCADKAVIEKVIVSALSRGEDNLACLMISLNPTVIKKSLVSLALKHTNINFLKVLWTGNYQSKEVERIHSRKKRSYLWVLLGQQVLDEEDRKKLARSLRISYILDQLLKLEKFAEAKEVLNWPEATNEPGIIKTLIAHGEQQLATLAIHRSFGGISKEDFSAAFNDKLYDLNVSMMRFKEALSILESQPMQQDLIRLLENGESCMQAMEMLSYIPNKSWHIELTKDLCNTLMRLAKKSNELLVCPSPILFCALTAEFASRLSTASLQHQNKYLAVAEVYKELGTFLESAIKEEEILRYYLQQKDSRGRSVLSIISWNGFYQMLDNDDIGSIVSKLWMGPIKHNGLLEASTLYYSFHSQPGTEDSLAFTKRMDTSKPFMFQYCRWLESCNLRFMAQGSSTILFLINYNYLIYQAVAANTFMDVGAHESTYWSLQLSQVWVTGIMIEHFLTYLFCWKTGRIFTIDNWRKIDIVMFSTMIVLMLGLHEYLLGEGKPLEEVNPVLFNSALHSIMMMMMWARFFSVLITSKRFGSFVRMIYLMAKQVINFIVLFICLIACFSAVFTSLFNQSSDDYTNYAKSVRTLYSSAIGVFDLMAFEKNEALGSILLGAYLLAAHVLLLNLLIALLANIYSQVMTRVDTEHRAVVISYYDRWYWDSTYGVLIFAPSPLSYLVLLASPFALLGKTSPKTLNTVLVKIFYVVYAIPQYLVFLTVSLLYVVPMYFKGFSIYGRARKSKIDNISVGGSEYSHARGLTWTIIGFPWLLWAVFRDSYDFWMALYIEHDIVVDSEKTKAQAIVNEAAIKSIQESLKSVIKKKIPVEQYVQIWMDFQQVDSPLTQEEFHEKKQLALDFFMQFAMSPKTPYINVELIQRLLPPLAQYNEEYVERVQNIHIPWLSKGLRQYQEKVGTLVIGGVSIPKELSVYGGRLDAAHLDHFQSSIHSLYSKHREITQSMEIIEDQVNEQRNTVKSFGRPLHSFSKSK